jgi:hypothetical protein
MALTILHDGDAVLAKGPAIEISKNVQTALKIRRRHEDRVARGVIADHFGATSAGAAFRLPFLFAGGGIADTSRT